MNELLVRAGALCGVGCEAFLERLALQFPEPLIWAEAVRALESACQRPGGIRSPLYYLTTCLRRAQARNEALGRVAQSLTPTPSTYLSGPSAPYIRR